MKEIKMYLDGPRAAMNRNRVLLTTLALSLIFTFWSHSAMTQEGKGHIERTIDQKVVKGPILVIKEDTIDLKEVKEGEVIEHTFQVFNQGDQTLEIKSVRPG
jgi:hypothetical protein